MFLEKSTPSSLPNKTVSINGLIVWGIISRFGLRIVLLGIVIFVIFRRSLRCGAGRSGTHVGRFHVKWRGVDKVACWSVIVQIGRLHVKWRDADGGAHVGRFHVERRWCWWSWRIGQVGRPQVKGGSRTWGVWNRSWSVRRGSCTTSYVCKQLLHCVTLPLWFDPRSFPRFDMLCWLSVYRIAIQQEDIQPKHRTVEKKK